MTDKLLDGHHALVTGAGSGIGAATALALARAGARVSLAGRRGAPLEEVARGMPQGSAAIVDSFDVTSEGAITGGLERARAALGSVTILVNNAGEAPSAPFE
jgi:NADP-dependent 3-hydroxy acid dehydrogenase YdfG